jgi:hypothetical protein
LIDVRLCLKSDYRLVQNMQPRQIIVLSGLT